MYLGIDLGTGTVKAAVVAGDGTVVASAEASYGRPLSAATTADFDPGLWWEATREVLARITPSHGGAIEAIGVTGQMHGVVLIDDQGRPVRDAVLWPDERAGEVLDVFTRFDARDPTVLANPIVAGMAGPILAWLARNEPDVMASASHAVQPKDWLRMQLDRAGPRTDPSDASATLLYDIASDHWSEALCHEIGLRPSLLPPIAPSASTTGPLPSARADELGLPSGTPVVVGAGDAPAALLGAGIEQTGDLLVNTGTGAQAMTPLQAPIEVPARSRGLHQYRSASDRTAWYAMAAIVNGGLALDWVRRTLDLPWNTLYATAHDALGPDTISDPLFLPFLSRERDPQLAGAPGGTWTGLRPDHDRLALARSAVQGVALYLAHRTRDLIDLTGASSITVAGGAIRHDGWVRLLATVLDHNVTVATDPHLTVRGAAHLAARGLGRHLPPPPPHTTIEPQHDTTIATARHHFEAALRTLPSFD